MVNYNPKVLEKWADRLYRRVYLEIIKWALISWGIGLIIAIIASYFLHLHLELTIFVSLIALIIGIGIGLSKTLELRARAQRDLWLVMMELRLGMIEKYLSAIAEKTAPDIKESESKPINPEEVKPQSNNPPTPSEQSQSTC